jgi:hypothetical protein
MPESRSSDGNGLCFRESARRRLGQVEDHASHINPVKNAERISKACLDGTPIAAPPKSLPRLAA